MTEDLHATLLDLEEQLWAANRKGDAGFYRELLTEDAMAVSTWGILDRESALAQIEENAIPFTASRISDPRVVPLTADSALLTYRADVEAVREGEPFAFSVYATSAWVRRDGRWWAAFHQQSLLPG